MLQTYEHTRIVNIMRFQVVRLGSIGNQTIALIEIDADGE
jgi:hypothetical protein